MSSFMPPIPTAAGPLPKELHDPHAKLGRRVDELVRQRAEHAERGDALRDAGAMLDIAAMQAHRDRGPLLVEMELALRREAATFERDHLQPWLARLADEAFAAIDAAEKTVRRGLLKLGYVEPDGTANVGVTTPGMVLAHPAVHEARAKHRELDAAARARDWSRENDEAITRCEAELARVRQALLRSVG